MARQVVQLLPATAHDKRAALEEVKDFSYTDMGYGGDMRWTYKVLCEPALSDELQRIARPQQMGSIDSVTFQPCQAYEQRSQDRHVVQRWRFPGGDWTFTAVFDGHVNHDAVDYVAERLPTLVRTSLEATLEQSRSSLPPPERISDLLSQAIVHIDNAITSDFVSLFPQEGSGMPPDVIKTYINDTASGGACHVRVSRMLGGTTALLTLLHEASGNFWVTNLGDSCAVLGVWTGSRWKGTLVNSIHNGGNALERDRVVSEHPGENECMVTDRILGWLAPTRAIGDGWLKLPRAYSERVFAHLDTQWVPRDALPRYVARLQTPPYVSCTPEVYHRRVRRRADGGSAPCDAFLMTCSDGVLDLARPEPVRLSQSLVDHWAGVIGRAMHPPDGGGRDADGAGANLALALLRDCIGGDDVCLVSRNLTVEMEERWMDDITIIVQNLG